MIEKITTSISMGVTISSFYGLGAMLNPDDYSLVSQLGWSFGGFTYSYVLTLTAIEQYSKAGLWGRVYGISALVALPYLMLTPSVYETYMKVYVSPQYPLVKEELRQLPKFNPSKMEKYSKLSDKEKEEYREKILPLIANYKDMQENREFHTQKILDRLMPKRREMKSLKRDDFKSWRDWDSAKKNTEYGKLIQKYQLQGVNISTINDIVNELYKEDRNEAKAKMNIALSATSVKRVSGHLISTKYQPLIEKYSDKTNQLARENKEKKLEEIETKSPLKEWMMYIILFMFGWVFETFAPRLYSNVKEDIKSVKKKREKAELKSIVGAKDFTNLELQKREDLMIEKQHQLTMSIINNSHEFLAMIGGEMNSKFNTLFSILKASMVLKPTTLLEQRNTGFNREAIQSFSHFVAKGRKEPYKINPRVQMKYRNFLMQYGAVEKQDGVRIPPEAVTELIRKIREEGY